MSNFILFSNFFKYEYISEKITDWLNLINAPNPQKMLLLHKFNWKKRKKMGETHFIYCLISFFTDRHCWDEKRKSDSCKKTPICFMSSNSEWWTSTYNYIDWQSSLEFINFTKEYSIFFFREKIMQILNKLTNEFDRQLKLNLLKYFL